MKKIFILLASIVMLTACGGSKEDPNGGGGQGGGGSTVPTITFGTEVNTNPVLGSGGGSIEVSFTSSDAWTAGVINTRADSWVTVSPASGSKGKGKITITAAANETPDERGATIQIKCGSIAKTITLTQKQKDAFTATASKTEIGNDGGSFTIEVKANVDFSFTIDQGTEWIKHVSTKALKTSTITFEVSKNEEVSKREGKVTVKSSVGNEVIKVYQAGATPTIVLSTNNASITATGGNFQVDVTHNVDVTVTIQEGITWLRETSSKATSTNSYVFTVDENTSEENRTADITFTNKANNLSEVVHVSQAGATPAGQDPIPGVFGLFGLNWEYAELTDQIVVGEQTAEFTFWLVKPATNKLVFIQLPNLFPANEEALKAKVGQQLNVTVYQNISTEVKGGFNGKVTLAKVEGSCLWIQDSNNKEAIIQYK